jgi:UDP-glucose 4-epimerase
MKCLVIGGAGFLGSSLTRLLVETGREVHVLGRHPKPLRELPRQVTYITGDVNDRILLSKHLKNTSEVIDLAYSTVPKTSFDDPLNDILSNLPCGVALLQEAAQSKTLKKLVIVSSGGTVYGRANSVPIAETHPTNPISPYGITKLTLEKYAGMFTLNFGLPVVIARPANAYGEEQAAFTGQGFIGTAIQSILQRKTVDIFGELGTIRDYVHISDIAQGIIAILEHGNSGDAYNIGSGIGRNNMEVLDLLRPFAMQSGLGIEFNILPERTFDVPANILDSQKLQSISGWHPEILFEDGLQRTWNSFFIRSQYKDVN